MTQPPIEDYALLGDTRTAALVSSAGAIDWMCAPRLDSDPVFGALIGGPDAGTFRIGPSAPGATVSERRYRAGTVTLETTWRTTDGRLTLTEGMVADVTGRLLPRSLLVRRLDAVEHAIDVEIVLVPRLGDLHRAPTVGRRGNATLLSWGALALTITSTRPEVLVPDAPQRVRVEPGAPLIVTLAVTDREPAVLVDPVAAWRALEDDERGWRTWTDDLELDLPHPDVVARSLLTLRLLTYSPSGAPVAAPTTSLPEHVGGVRNWDYRFAWPRDASIGVDAFLGVGNDEEARRFLFWLLHASRTARPQLPVLLTLHGRHTRPERELDRWAGYLGSQPVRSGNGAATQRQHDGYGWVLDAAWRLTSGGHRLYSETWRAMRAFADEAASVWSEPDAGIWEIRGDGAHHVHSKVMSWLAIDRALRIAETRRTPVRHVLRWTRARGLIEEDVRAKGFNPAVGAYTREYGADDLDAALLRLPMTGFEDPLSPRIVGTVDAIRARLSAGPLVYRYTPGTDGLPGTEGAFLPCSFWLVQALAMTGRIEDAHELYAELTALASGTGLYAEEMDPTTRRHLGNYPQALTHASLVQAALTLQRHSTLAGRDQSGP